MAQLYVRSGGTGGSWSGTVYTTLELAIAASAAGDIYNVSEDHAQTTGAGGIGLTFPGTLANPNLVRCVDHNGSVPPVSADIRTTATLTTTSGGNILFESGYAVVNGLQFFSNGSFLWFGHAVSAPFGVTFNDCKGTLTAAGAAYFVYGPAGSTTSSYLILNNFTFKFGALGQAFYVQQEYVEINGGSIDAGGSVPTNLFTNAGTPACQFIMKGFDLSALGSNTIIPAFGTAAQPQIGFIGCKFGASAVVSAAQTTFGRIYVVNSDSAATNYRNEQLNHLGSQVPETTIIRTGGATDGTTPIATKIVTTANASRSNPFTSAPLAVWNDTTAANVTVTVYGVWGGGAVPNNDDIWVEVWYMGSSASPIFTINTTNGPADALAAGTAQGTDAVSTWGGSTTKFKMAVTLSSPQPGMKGDIYVVVKAAAASSTFYVDVGLS